MREQKSEFYQLLQQQAQSLIEDETDLIANMANLSALLFNEMPDLNWSGFYILRDEVSGKYRLSLKLFYLSHRI